MTKLVTKADMTKAWLLSFESGKLFNDSKLKDSKQTALNYTNSLYNYCQYLQAKCILTTGTYENPNLEELLSFKPNLDEKMEAREQHKKLDSDKGDKLLISYIADESVPYTIRKTTAVCVKSFYASNMRELHKETARTFITEKKRIKEQKSPSLKDCIEIEKAMTNARDRFFVWLLESSPVRDGSLKLNWEDLKPTGDSQVPLWFEISAENLKGHGKGKYAKAHHVGFLHSYAVEKLEAYKLELADLGLPCDGKTPLFVEYKKNICGSEKGKQKQTFNAVLKNACLSAFGKDATDKHYSPHDFRDLLSSILGLPTVKADEKNLPKFLLSHAPQGIEANYEHYVKNGHVTKEAYEMLLVVYKQCLPYLLPPTLDKIEQLEAENAALDIDNKINREEMQVMKNQQETDQKTIAELKQQMEFLMKMMMANQQNSQQQQQTPQKIAPLTTT